MTVFITAFLATIFAATAPSFASEEHPVAHMTAHPGAIICLVIFILSYVGVLLEEKTHLRKSKPVMLGAGLIWVTIGLMAGDYNIDHHVIRAAIFHGLGEFSSLMLFLLSAMTYISALQERRVFATLRAKLVAAGFNLRQMFWITGILAFCLSPVADNLTTALVMGAVVMAVGGNNPKFVSLACINIVSAANAGGAFSPFGDITTLMVWQAEKAEFFEFFSLFLPAAVNFLLPAIIMNFFVPKTMPWSMRQEEHIKRGGKVIIALGFLTIALAIGLEQALGLPPFLGMMMGLAILMFWGYVIRTQGKNPDRDFDIFKTVATAEWDTLLFFFGVIFSVSGLTFVGFLELASQGMYGNLGPSVTNIALGFTSAVIDNIPVMFAVIAMDPEMSHFQWLLITLTTGVGGTMLSIGSAAGVALMGVARGQYTFLSHLKWTPVVFLGYAAAVAVHFIVNAHHMATPGG